MSGYPLVSVLIPTYNRPDYCEMALQSALEQTWKNVEIVVSDDSDNDLTQRVVVPYTERFASVRYVRNRDRLGAVRNFQAALRLARGEYVSFLMDDDLLGPTKIERMMSFFLGLDGVSIVTSYRQVIDGDGHVLPDIPATRKLFDRDTVLDGIALGDIALRRLTNVIGEPTTTMFRKGDLAEPFGVFMGRQYGCNVDMASWISLLSVGKAAYVADPLSYFRLHGGQQSQSLPVAILGAADWMHQVTISRRLGFLARPEDFLSTALKCVRLVVALTTQAADLGCLTGVHDLGTSVRMMLSVCKKDPALRRDSEAEQLLGALEHLAQLDLFQGSRVPVIDTTSVTPGRYTNVRENVAPLHNRREAKSVAMTAASNLQEIEESVQYNGANENRTDSNRTPVVSSLRTSVVVVTYNSLGTIARCIESVLSTLGPQDEVIVVDNASVDETPYYLKTLASQEKRLVVRVLESNRGYAAGAVEGMRLAKGKFVIFLNPDTQVFGPWVERLLEPMLKDPDVAASGPVSNYAAGLQNVGLYADIKGRTGQVAVEQICQELDAQWQGKLVDTKLLIGFCLVVRREALEKIGGLDEALYLGNDDLDLSWRLQQAGYKQVVVPSVFVYHQGQASFNTEPKVRTKYLVQQSTNQLYEKLYAAYGGKVPSGQELWNISWFTPQRDLLSIVIPVHKDPEATRQCLESIVRHTHRPYEIIVVDNAADNETKGVLKEFAQRLGNLIVITNDANLGYPRACNQGLEAATGEYIAVMNNDVIVTPYWASRLLAAFAVDPQVGAVGPRTNYAVGPQRVETANYTLAELDQWAAGWHRDHAGNLTPTGRLIGFLVVLKRKLVDDIGGFDPLFGVGNFEDDDLSLRALLKGYKLVIAEDVFIHHHGSRSFGSIPQKYLRLMDTNGKLFAAKWGVRLDKGAYSPGDVLNQRGRYGRAELYIPLSFESMFAPDVEALDVGTGAPNRFLCVPDPSDPLESWLDLFRNYFAAFGDGGATAESATSASQAPTMHQNTASGAEQETQGQIAGGERPSQALIIRAEPAEQSWVDRLVDGLKSVAKEIDIDLDKRDDLVVEARSIPSAMRGQVYRAATVFVPLPGVRRESLVREAEACGLRVLSGYTPQDLVGAVLGGPAAETREAEAVR